jgi:DNA-binding GntR family transcriptional regulator
MRRMSNVVSLRGLLGDRYAAAEGELLHEAVYRAMRESLMDGRIAPGQTFTLRSLAEVFGVSLMPVRDALKQLVAEHALELRANRSVVLPHMSRSRFQEILQIRLSLEPMITARAAALVTPDLIRQMAADDRQMSLAIEAGDAASYLAANRRFHFRLYAAAGTQVLLPIIESMWVQVGPYLNQMFDVRALGSARKAVHHHDAVLVALRRNDATAAAQAIWNDLAEAADSILAADHFS